MTFAPGLLSRQAATNSSASRVDWPWFEKILALICSKVMIHLHVIDATIQSFTQSIKKRKI